MNRKDQKLIWEAYLSGQEASELKREDSWDDMSHPPSVFERALADPTNFVLHITSQDGEDYEGNYITYPEYAIYELTPGDAKYGDYERVTSYDDIEEIVDAFETKNPGGIKDER